MNWMPPIPPWNGCHVLVVHFPIALLLVAPLFILLGLVVPRLNRAFYLAGLLLLALGACGVILAVEAGEAAALLVQPTPEISRVLLHHANLGETTRNVFSGLAVVLLLIFVAQNRLTLRLGRGRVALLYGVFLLGYLANILFLVQTADLGGRLVHQYGIRAHVAAQAPSP